MGSFRRRIVVVVSRNAPHGGEARAALEDDFHHFRVALRHERGRVSGVEGEALRNPYTLCPSAAGRLPQLVGMALSPAASAVGRAADASEQCTHLFDLAGLALAAAATGRPRVVYDIEVPDRAQGRTRARLARDGAALLAWDLDGTAIAAPASYAGVSLRKGFGRWALAALPADLAEAAVVLRRCALISLGRGKPLDLQLHAVPTGLCYAQQPARAEQALRVVGSTWDFSDRAGELCAGDADWLAFGAGEFAPAS